MEGVFYFFIALILVVVLSQGCVPMKNVEEQNNLFTTEQSSKDLNESIGFQTYKVPIDTEVTSTTKKNIPTCADGTEKKTGNNGIYIWSNCDDIPCGIKPNIENVKIDYTNNTVIYFDEYNNTFCRLNLNTGFYEAVK